MKLTNYASDIAIHLSTTPSRLVIVFITISFVFRKYNSFIA